MGFWNGEINPDKNETSKNEGILFGNRKEIYYLSFVTINIYLSKQSSILTELDQAPYLPDSIYICIVFVYVSYFSVF